MKGSCNVMNTAYMCANCKVMELLEPPTTPPSLKTHSHISSFTLTYSAAHLLFFAELLCLLAGVTVGASSAIKSMKALGFPAPYPPCGVPCTGDGSTGFAGGTAGSDALTSSAFMVTIGGASEAGEEGVWAVDEVRAARMLVVAGVLPLALARGEMEVPVPVAPRLL